jgi:hypothetical protein
MKKLVIIHGVTGAIGSACLATFASQKDTVVYGISRKAKDFREFCVNGKLPIATLICSISSETYPSRMATFFAQAIDSEAFSEVYYIHALGVHPFEIDSQGNRTVSFDNDADGIDDRCKELASLFISFHSSLPHNLKKHVRSFLFGSIADKYEPFAHMSWWKTMNWLKNHLSDIAKSVSKNGSWKAKYNRFPFAVSLINISSVLCPNELITRPYVLCATDSNPEYWLLPTDVSIFIDKLIKKGQTQKFKEYSLFKKLPNFDEGYYADENFTPRKVKELFNV